MSNEETLWHRFAKTQGHSETSVCPFRYPYKICRAGTIECRLVQLTAPSPPISTLVRFAVPSAASPCPHEPIPEGQSPRGIHLPWVSLMREM